jgi:hypothetical protein
VNPEKRGAALEGTLGAEVVAVDGAEVGLKVSHLLSSEGTPLLGSLGRSAPRSCAGRALHALQVFGV